MVLPVAAAALRGTLAAGARMGASRGATGGVMEEERVVTGASRGEDLFQRARHAYTARQVAVSKKEQELAAVKENKPGLIGYSPIFSVALFKDMLDLALVGSFPGVGTLVTFCFSLLIFVMLLLTRSNKKLIDSRFLLRWVVTLILGSMVEGFIFGLNFLPIETITILVIYLMDKHLSNEQIEKVTQALQSLHGKHGKTIRGTRHVGRRQQSATSDQQYHARAAANDETYNNAQKPSAMAPTLANNSNYAGNKQPDWMRDKSVDEAMKMRNERFAVAQRLGMDKETAAKHILDLEKNPSKM